MLNKTLFNVRALAAMEDDVAYAAAEEPVEERDMPRLNDVKIAADNRGPCGVALKHRAFKFFQTPQRMSEYEVEVKDAHEFGADGNIHEKASSIALS